MAFSFFGDRFFTRVKGLVRVRNNTSFLMMFPTPAKID